MDPEKIAHAVELTLRIPSKYKQFTADEEFARSVGLGLTALAAANEVGLQHENRGARRKWDERDLRTVAIWGVPRTPRRAAMQLWLRTADRINDGVSYVIEPGGAAATDSMVVDYLSSRGEFTCRAESPQVPNSTRQFISEFSDVEFVHLNPSAREEPELLFRERIADCYSFTQHVHQAASDAGLVARRAWGVIVSAPFSSPHSWTEFSVDGKWIPLDIHMASALCKWGLVRNTDESAIQIAERLGKIYWRWDENRADSIMSSIEDGKLSLRTRVV